MLRGGERCVRIRAGYCAVPDFAESPVDAVELLLTDGIAVTMTMIITTVLFNSSLIGWLKAIRWSGLDRSSIHV